MILKGKRVLIAGMSDRRSIGFSIAQEAQRSGAEVLLTSFGRMMSITQMTAKKLDPVPEILEMDVTKPSDIASALKETSKRWDRSEEHTSELQSHLNLVCRLLLEKKK